MLTIGSIAKHCLCILMQIQCLQPKQLTFIAFLVKKIYKLFMKKISLNMIGLMDHLKNINYP
ncbi:MAG: hypothetical protein A2511_06040 [Deltaproteobacteria bacterium RIFOXYD12_FULL_50_9]|nr:MAG: hypothetical protein A2511_06040 [Deltaproteobacteria bacterium RIFOXYD12_FULL_50_9]